MRKKRVTIYQKRWHIAATLLIIAVPFAFLLVFSRFAHIATGKLLKDTFVSLLRIAIAYAVAAPLGWMFAALFYNGRRATVALPIFDVLQSLPTFAALPLAITFLGGSNLIIIFFLALEIIWPIFFSVVSSLKLIHREWEEAVEVSGLRKYHYLRYFLWPASIPSFVTGSIVGLGNGWEGLIALEIIIGVNMGLGGFFQTFSGNPTITAFGILGFLIIIFTINKLVWLPLLEQSHHGIEE